MEEIKEEGKQVNGYGRKQKKKIINRIQNEME